MNFESEAGQLREIQGPGQFVLIWILFLLVCLGLGYPTLKRYEPSRTAGLSDAGAYHRIVTGERVFHPRADIFEGRILIPFVAKPFARFAASRLQTWEPISFGLLVANSLFCATAALLLVRIGQIVGLQSVVALLAAMLYLLNFAIANFHLAGLVDSGEACCLLAITWSLLTGRWWLLPIWAVAGVLNKETMMPMAAIFSVVWWSVVEHPQGRRFVRLGWIAATILLSVATILLVHYALHGHIVWPWEIASAMNLSSNYLLGLLRCISDRSFWYIFAWLLPLGLWRLKSLPRPWALASTCTALAVLALGAYSDMGGTVGRPIFSILGPQLSLSSAMLLTNKITLPVQAHPGSV